MDAATLTHAGPMAPNQLLSLFGANLGPEEGAGATSGSVESLAGVRVTFDGVPGQLLYVSSTQINVAVPSAVASNDFTEMQVEVNGTFSEPRRVAMWPMIPNLFVNLSTVRETCVSSVSSTATGPLVFAQNQDGTLNSCEHPAKAGSVISFFMTGIGLTQRLQNLPILVQIGRWSAEVVDVVADNEFVWRVAVRVPVAAIGEAIWTTSASVSMEIDFTGRNIPAGRLSFGRVLVGPLTVRSSAPSFIPDGLPFPMRIWVAR
jgi:uncharacterized protein (TIGR03437 family)